MLVAGEASGDLHAGHLAESLLRARPDLRLFGMGGETMRRAGVETLVDIADVAVVGLWEVLAHFPEIKRAFGTLDRALRERKPDLVVLVDYPDFNLRLAARARAAGVPVVYYISPQVWAWRKGRVKTMAGLIRRMLVIYPFEERIYREAGIDCVYVGNPLVDAPPDARGREELAAAFGLDPGRPILGLLPGSRRGEIARHLPIMRDAFRILSRRLPGLQGVVPVAPTLRRGDLEAHLAGEAGIVLVEGDTPGVMRVSDAAAVCSGTATLQTALQGTPMVIIYRLAWPSYLVGRLLIRMEAIGLANIVAGRRVAPELIQGEATPARLAAELAPYLEDPVKAAVTRDMLADLRARMGDPGASDRAAASILELLPDRGAPGP
jgi:lipid-A-disaccharide synthase